MSSSHVLCCLPSVKKQNHDGQFFFVRCIIKQLLDSVFVISRIIKVPVSVISFSLGLITPTSNLISNGIRTEWSPIRSVSMSDNKSDNRAAGVRFVYQELFLTELDNTKSGWFIELSDNN